MNLMTEIAARLREDGWTVDRNGKKHVLWKCPCGQHRLAVSRPGARGNLMAALQITQKRMRQCRAGRASSLAASTRRLPVD